MGSSDNERIAALEAERARLGQATAEVERDMVAGVAVNEASRRTAAENAAANERVRADMAESGARSASASARAAHEDARDERAAAGNASFVATIATIVALALIAVVGYFAWWQPNHAIDVPTNTVIERTEKTVTTPASQSAAPTVNVAPPHVDVNVENTPPAASSQQSDSNGNANQSDNGTSGDNNSSGPGSGG